MTAHVVNTAIVLLYILSMVGIGWYAKRRARTQTDFLVAGRRLGPLLYSGTMAAVVLGGASTIGGIGLGYTYGISGMWLVFAIGCGILLLSLAFSARINRLKVFTVGQMLDLRYGNGSRLVSSVVMAMYTLMLAVTSTIAYATILSVLFDIGKVPAILLGGGVVVLYSCLGGMWSITLTDFVQFLVKTVGIFAVLLPVVLWRVGGISGLRESLPDSFFQPFAIGGDTIVTYFVIYFFGLVIGQDIWQRVFTARSDAVARAAGTVAGVYCLAYAVAGALVGMCAAVLAPNLANSDDAFATVVENELPVGLAGLVIAAALAAVMSTSSGALIATSTVVQQDLVAAWRHRGGAKPDAEDSADAHDVRGSRLYILGFGLVMIVLASLLDDVVAALTVAYDILVGGLLVAIVGGLVWRRGTRAGALVSMALGTVATLVTMALTDVLANEPVYVGLLVSAVSYVAVSLLTPPTPAAVLREWTARSAGHSTVDLTTDRSTDRRTDRTVDLTDADRPAPAARPSKES
ncbi:sodium:solute symporter [Kineococcus gynurae]|uniref:Sodium:solute symporter n=1 Tax=Kineococcus gynurae TaxID=452979 RepID=A0ABV5LW53_9ACTN